MTTERLITPEIRTASGISIEVYRPHLELTNEEIESWHVLTAHGNFLTAESIYNSVGVKTRYIEPTENIKNTKPNSEAKFIMAGKATHMVLWDKSARERELDAIFVASSF